MEDLIIKQTGNSRLLKSSLASGTTWEEALAMLQTGTFPIDLLGLQSDGVEQMGTYFNKANMLDDDTVSTLGLDSDDPTPNEALLALANSIKVAGTKYGTCSTASGTATKVGSISGFTLSTGAVVAIKFSNINTASSPKLNVNSTGAKSIYDWRTAAYPKVGAMLNGTHLFVYNGSQWVLLNPNPGSTLSLESLSWSTINSFSSAGIASSLFSVGDTKSVSLSGTVGARTFSSETVYAFILGFDHNSSNEGTKKIHFQFGKTSTGTDIAFTDDSYNSTGSTAAFRMNTTNTNSGGWDSSYMKGTLIPEFTSCLPSALQNVIQTITKYTDNTGGGSNTASYVTATSETIFLLSEYEVQGARTYANSAEATYQAQYAYYANGNAKIKYRDSATTTACIWWLRSPYATNTTNFCSLNTNGTANHYNAYYSIGFAPGFCV